MFKFHLSCLASIVSQIKKSEIARVIIVVYRYRLSASYVFVEGHKVD